MAAGADTRAAYISQFKGGNVALPGMDIRRRLAEALDVSPVELLIAAGNLDRADFETVGGRVVSQVRPIPAEVQRILAGIDWDADSIREAVTVPRLVARGQGAFKPRIDPSKYN